ncbi:sigma-70 family RNA polymerase sigma factor [candidate division KSB1 bacterium]|nr:sigma-70 family RNA polymerase sigma factor [candidate division KSB1 bacterium]RQW10181.1 MAG: sigma-70 family RNA polymerase sigma factor [candidate division KSB1 bacterium]
MSSRQRHRLEESFRSEYEKLLSYVRSRMPLYESEDLVQEVYVKALRSLNVLDTVDNLVGWLYVVARNKIIDWYRRAKLPTVPLDSIAANGMGLQELLAEEISDDWDDEMRARVVDAIIDSVDELPDEQRFAFIQNVIEGRTFRELAAETGESINTLLARKRYAVRFLQDRLREIKDLNEN